MSKSRNHTTGKLAIENMEHIRLSEKDSLSVLEILENPPKPNARLRAAARGFSMSGNRSVERDAGK